MGLVILAGAAAVYAVWQQMQQEQPPTGTATASPVSRSGQDDGLIASLAKGVYEAIENFSPTDPDWVIGTGESSDATDPAQNE